MTVSGFQHDAVPNRFRNLTSIPNEDKVCPCDSETQDSENSLWDCPEVDKERTALFAALQHTFRQVRRFCKAYACRDDVYTTYGVRPALAERNIPHFHPRFFISFILVIVIVSIKYQLGMPKTFDKETYVYVCRFFTASDV